MLSMQACQLDSLSKSLPRKWGPLPLFLVDLPADRIPPPQPLTCTAFYGQSPRCACQARSPVGVRIGLRAVLLGT